MYGSYRAVMAQAALCSKRLCRLDARGGAQWRRSGHGRRAVGHAPQTFMRYVRANDHVARGAIDKMVEGLPAAGEPLSTPTHGPALRVVPGGRSSDR